MTTTIIPFSSVVHLAIPDDEGQEIHWRAEAGPDELVVRTWTGGHNAWSATHWQTCDRLTRECCLNRNPVFEMRRRAAMLLDSGEYEYCLLYTSPSPRD